MGVKMDTLSTDKELKEEGKESPVMALNQDQKIEEVHNEL